MTDEEDKDRTDDQEDKKLTKNKSDMTQYNAGDDHMLASSLEQIEADCKTDLKAGKS